MVGVEECPSFLRRNTGVGVGSGGGSEKLSITEDLGMVILKNSGGGSRRMDQYT